MFPRNPASGSDASRIVWVPIPNCLQPLAPFSYRWALPYLQMENLPMLNVDGRQTSYSPSDKMVASPKVSVGRRLIDPFVSFLILLLSACWLAAAIYVALRPVNLSQRYFHKGLLNNTGRYNTLVTFLGTIFSIAVGFGISLGFKHFVSHKLRTGGLSLRKLQHFVNLAGGQLSMRLSFTFLTTLAMLLIISQLSTATQAAFGTSTGRLNMTTGHIYAPLSSNIDFFVNLANSGFIEPSADFSVNAKGSRIFLDPSQDGIVAYQIDGNRQDLSRSGPAVPLLVFGTFTMANEQNYTHLISSKDSSIIGASQGRVMVYAKTDAIISKAVCELVPLTDRFQNGYLLYNDTYVHWTMESPCGPFERVYLTNQTTIPNPGGLMVDSFGCTNGAPTVSIILTYNVTSLGSLKTPSVMLDCNVTVLTQPVEGWLLDATNAGGIGPTLGAPVTTGAFAGALTTGASSVYWNQNGLQGNPDLLDVFMIGFSENNSWMDLGAVVVEAVTTTAAIQLLDSTTLEINSITPIDVSDAVTTPSGLLIGADVLVIGLSGVDLAWFVVPGLAFLILLWGLWQAVAYAPGSVDPTNPLSLLAAVLDTQRTDAGGGDRTLKLVGGSLAFTPTPAVSTLAVAENV